MQANAIAQRAIDQIGTPFRFRGRAADVGLDCVGLVLVALGPLADARAGQLHYTMRGDYRAAISDYFASLPFQRLGADVIASDGDILLVRPAPSQMHLMVFAADGWVHAHAGLRRVVFSPAIPAWQIIDRWRLVGD
ncbi:MAG: peptidoglycan endopeptidase [Sphingomonadales bacterium]|jgi:lipoprotein Spr|nr:peptidoglycan endopeptidase [Sphingomonadales bacterium]MBK9004455.1 peptidoglycan endopeptidase [Sphingomonadales bacterium]MBK9269641.1 peptidoglycan endopeptidase [Sphingomonadales bacterium]